MLHDMTNIAQRDNSTKSGHNFLNLMLSPLFISLAHLTKQGPEDDNPIGTDRKIATGT
jgi:hypothetical protein